MSIDGVVTLFLPLTNSSDRVAGFEVWAKPNITIDPKPQRLQTQCSQSILFGAMTDLKLLLLLSQEYKSRCEKHESEIDNRRILNQGDFGIGF